MKKIIYLILSSVFIASYVFGADTQNKYSPVYPGSVEYPSQGLITLHFQGDRPVLFIDLDDTVWKKDTNRNYSLTEPGLTDRLQELSKENVLIIPLTSRPAGSKNSTELTLKDLNLDLSKWNLDKNDRFEFIKKHSHGFIDGDVIYCNGVPKGWLLATFITKFAQEDSIYRPTSITFVDDDDSATHPKNYKYLNETLPFPFTVVTYRNKFPS